MYTASEVILVISGYTGILAMIFLAVGIIYAHYTSADRIEIFVVGSLLAILSLLLRIFV